MPLSVNKLLRQAQGLAKVGRIIEAKNIYKSVLAKFPKNRIANQAYQKLKSEVGVKGSPNLEPPQDQMQELVNLYNNGQFEEVLSKVKPLISLFSKQRTLFNLIGASNAALERYDAAIDSYEQAIKIDPDYVDAHMNKGSALQGKGDLDEAIESFRIALTINPDHAYAFFNLGNVFTKKNYFNLAIENYRKAIKITPNYAEAYFNMGNAFKANGEFDIAIDAYTQALKIRADYAEVYNNIGLALFQKHILDSARENFEKAIAIKPDYAEAHNNLGITFRYIGDLESALDCYKRALRINPLYTESYSNMGNTLQDKGELDAAIKSYKQAIKIQHGDAEAYYNLALVHNLQGDLKIGFELYEWRLQRKAAQTRPSRVNYTWDGQKCLQGKCFVVYEEQGLGDIIQFCRYLTSLERMGAKVIFKVKPKLHSLLKVLTRKVILSNDWPKDNHIDFEAPLLSLPHLFNTQLNTIPAPSPHLYSDEGRILHWQSKFRKCCFKVGICWQGSNAEIDIGRSFPLSLFENISLISGVELISLHKGEGERQIDGLNFDVTILGSEFDAGQDAFLDTAAVMMTCDLIITSDTAVAHLAGALGRSTWVALKNIPDWRWMLGVPNSPWYPTITLYRQKIRGDWAGVFNIIERDLRLLINQEGQ